MSQAGLLNIQKSGGLPNQSTTLVDDFIANTDPNGQLNWITNNIGEDVNGTAAHPGLLIVHDGAESGIVLGNYSGFNYSYVLGGGSYSSNYVFSLVTLSDVGNRYTVYIGMMDNYLSAPANGVYFTYSDNANSGNWVLNCTSSSVTTSVNTTTPAITGYVNLGVSINPDASLATFTINGVIVGTIATNIPTSPIGISFLWIRSSGALPASLIDLFYMTTSLTTPR